MCYYQYFCLLGNKDWQRKQPPVISPNWLMGKKRTVIEKPPQQVEKLPGPKPIPGLVGKHLIAEYKMDPALVRLFKAVVRRSPKA